MVNTSSNSLSIEATSLCKSYQNHTALDQLNLEVPESSIYGLLGPNGAGKTTFIRIINQIIEADSGTLKLFGEELKPSHVQLIGYLPEERGLYRKMKVGEYLEYLGKLRGLKTGPLKEKINAALERFDLSNWRKREIQDLSKGMQQKVQFIATIVHDPKLIILDEPFSGFDPINANLIKEEILKLRDDGATIMLSTHRMESVEELCENIGLMHNSKLVLQGEKHAVKQQFKANEYTIKFDADAAFAIDPLIKILGTTKLPHEGLEVEEWKVHCEDKERVMQLVNRIASKQQLHAFNEVIPSINDIFIQMASEQPEAIPHE